MKYIMSTAPSSTIGATYFEVDENTGIISMKQPVLNDITRRRQYTFQVFVEDRGVPPKRNTIPANVVITVIRNENPPVLQPLGAQTVSRTAQPSTTVPVFTVRATDADTSAPFNIVKYYMIGDSPANNYFRVDENSGAVTLVAPLTGNELEYKIRVEARDGGSPSLTDRRVFVVNINRNLFAPAFSPTVYNGQIFETDNTGKLVVTVRATDNDDQPPQKAIVYAVMGSQTYFDVEPNTGKVFLKQSVLGVSPRSSEYRFNISATDGGTPSKTAFPSALVIVKVLRDNNGPVFTKIPTITITELQQPGLAIDQIIATDADTAPNPYNIVRYRLIGDSPGDAYFTVVQNSGNIAVKPGAQLANSNQLSYTLRIQAYDNGQPSLTNTTTVSVTINRNFRDPYWTQSVYNITIPDTQAAGIPFLPLLAKDDDRVRFKCKSLGFNLRLYETNL
ncbi:cadherin EGF LAG seven-pass G-type receptor 2-like [Tubulanus polymorphus]|uniref:cadherin EGF LAG seven-pass G-type receptor 2-like n=1 Tax=Tubulanus polymorphus TaxID=672921 RepID=UPI003DA3A9EE